jgi:RNA polymerase subunit RPABC4/transcription elongation factor Spt4
MKKVCENCREIFAEIYSECPECGSEENIIISTDDICPLCGKYHDVGAFGDYKYELKPCFDVLYTEGRALEYIMTEWSLDEIQSNVKWLNESYTNRTIKDCIFEEVDEIRAFIKFVAECEAERDAESARLDRLILPMPRKAAV